MPLNFEVPKSFLPSTVGPHLVNRLSYINVREDFGAQGDATVNASGVVEGTDDGPAIQRALDEALEYGGIVYFPEGRYRIDTQVKIDDNSTIDARDGVRFQMLGNGPGSSVIYDTVSSGAGISFAKPASKSILSAHIEGIDFKLGIDKNTSTSFYCKQLSDTSRFVNCRFGSRPVITETDEFTCLRLTHFESCLLLKFDSCQWWAREPAIVCQLDGSDNLDGIIFDHCQIQKGESNCGLYARVTGGLNRLVGRGWKSFGQSRNIQSITHSTLTNWTASSTSIDIGSGHTLDADDVLHLSSDQGSEVVVIASYTGSTATLREGLKVNHSLATDADILGPSLGIAVADGVDNFDFQHGMCEGAYMSLANVQCCNIAMSTFGSDMADATDATKQRLSGGRNTRPINFHGANRMSIRVDQNRFIGTQTKEVLVLDTAGGTTQTIRTFGNVIGAGGAVDDEIVDTTVETGARIRAVINQPQSWHARNHSGTTTVGAAQGRIEVADRAGSILGYIVYSASS